VSRPAPLSLDALIAPWCAALDAAQSAVRLASAFGDGRELSEHSARLSQQRRDVARLLHGVARELHTDSPLLGWLNASSITPSMLGLPKGVIACVFDLDGVLTTSARVHVAAWAQTFDSFLWERAERGHHAFVPFDRRHEYHDYVAGRSRLAGAHAFLASRSIRLPEGSRDDVPAAETVYGLANRKNLVLQDLLERDGVAAFAGSRSYLEGARILGLRCAVVSASANTENILVRSGLADLIQERIDAGAVEVERLRPKPAPDVLLAACQRLHVRPDQVAAFDTTASGIDGARAAGARMAIAVDRDGDARALRASHPDLVVNDVAELFTHAGV
jgi:HAD superfamily hydrolase (TIGR01509 family)